MTKASFLGTLLGMVVVAAGILAAVAMAWPQQQQPRAPQPKLQPPAATEPAELPVGSPSQAGLYFPE